MTDCFLAILALHSDSGSFNRVQLEFQQNHTEVEVAWYSATQSACFQHGRGSVSPHRSSVL
jgi:hypothetical protein